MVVSGSCVMRVGLGYGKSFEKGLVRLRRIL